jgi:uncharacterized protein (DUF2147 family)
VPPCAFKRNRLTDNGKTLDVRGCISVPMPGRSQTWLHQE